MKILLARLLLAFTLLWLPLQTYAAQTMPYCQKHHAHATAASTSSHHAGCHDHGQDAANHPIVAKVSLACDDCFACHLVIQPALIVSPPALAADDVKTQQPLSSPSILVFFPDQPQRPPLASIS